MALIVEDGTCKPDANTYVSVETFKLYAKHRGVEPPASVAECEILLAKAWDAMCEGSPYMRGRRYIGERSTRDQAGDWPRDDVEIDNFPYSNAALPRYVEQAQCALACALTKVPELLPTESANASGAVIEETVGPLTVRYSNPGRVRAVPADASADALLNRICRRSGLFAIRA